MKILNKQTATILCVVMIIASCLSGTLAYLTSEAGDRNTFVIGKIKIELSETDTEIDDDEDITTNTYKIEEIGQTITKDPKVTVLSGSVPCWLYVEISESENFDEFLAYEIAEGWTKLDDTENIYYRKIEERVITDTEYQVLKNDFVKVKEDVAIEALNLLTDESYPSLTVKAYAVQMAEEGTELGTAKDAWDQIDTQSR